MTNEELIALVKADESDDDSDLGFLVEVAGKLEEHHVLMLISLAIALRDKGDEVNEADRVEDSIALDKAQEVIEEVRKRLGEI